MRISIKEPLKRVILCCIGVGTYSRPDLVAAKKNKIQKIITASSMRMHVNFNELF